MSLHWTISRLKDFETCRKRYHYRYVLRTPEPGPKSKALERGIRIHESIEHYLDGTSPDLDPEISPAWALQIKGLKALEAKPEVQWELEEGWHPWEGGQLWLRMKLDAHWRYGKDGISVVDFKTGKPYTSNMEQIEVYALGAFAMFDDVTTVAGELWYLDSDEPHEKSFKRSDAPKLARKWETRANAMLRAKEFPATVGRACSWCPYKDVCPDTPRVVR